MIKTIHINNFQCHESKRIDLNEGITVITGSSDTGKSAIIRAVQWLRTNRPRGTAFLRSGAENCSVTIKTDRGTVKRFRTKQENGYIVDGKKLVAVGTGVPIEATKILGLSDLNVQMQHDPPFLLTLSPGDVGKTLNEYADLSEVDSLLQELNKRSSATKRKLTDTEQEATRLDVSLKIFESLPVLTGKQEAIYDLERVACNLVLKRTECGQHISRIDDLEKQAGSFASVPKLEEKRDRTFAVLQRLSERLVKNSRIEALLQGIEEHTADARICVPAEKLDHLEKLFAERKKLTEETKWMSDCLLRISAQLQEQQEAVGELEQLPKEAVCPTCGSVVQIEGHEDD